jgi:hypothetical protein
MSNLLIGSSNLARFYKPELFKDFRPYQMMKCTTMDSFSALMTELEDGRNNVIISVFENIITDAAKPAKTDDTANNLIQDAIKTAVKLINRTASRLPDSRFCIVMPLTRPAHKWFQEKQKLIEDNIRESIRGCSASNITRVNCVCHSLQQFETDGIHLTSESGAIFIEAILKASEEIFIAIQVYEEEAQGGPQDLGGLVAVLKTRFESDNLMFAHMREEIDSTANRSREDRVVVTCITCKTPLPRENRQRIEKLKELAKEVFEAIKPGFKGQILYASQGRNNDHMLPMVEVKMDKVEHAVEIRKAFAVRRKKEKMTGCLEKIFISNSINVGTRVRIEILKAIAKKMTNEHEFAYVVSFISRPVIHFKLKNDTTLKPLKSYTFIDAVKQFGSKLNKTDLLGAYAKAGKAFTGQLEQNFVVLKESDAEDAQTNFHSERVNRGGGRGGSYRGRGRGGGEGQGHSDANKEPMGNRGTKRSGDGGETSAPKK